MFDPQALVVIFDSDSAPDVAALKRREGSAA